MLRLVGTILLIAAAAAPAFGQSLEAATSFTFIVSSSGDEGDIDFSDGACVAATGGCTLRAAIEQANTMPGTDLVEIVVQVPEIEVPYPREGFVITRDEVLVRGAQVLSGCGTQLPVQIFGADNPLQTVITRGDVRPGDDDGVAFEVLARNVSIQGLRILGFQTGIAVGNDVVPGHAFLSCLAIHENDNGVSFVNQESDGRVESSALYGNADFGINVNLGATAEIHRNCIGLGPSCQTRSGNQIGIRMSSGVSITENVVSGNDVGISQIPGPLTASVEVLDNSIGTDWTGTKEVGNRVGLELATSFPFGDPGEVRGNLVSGNDEVGISCEYCEVTENLVGVDETGRQALPNGIGISLRGNGNFVGTVSNNLVSGNDSTGVEIHCGGGSASGNVIGLNIAENAPLGNGGPGIHVLRCANDDQGGISTTGIMRNAVAFNGGDGIRLGSVPSGSLYEIEGVAIDENRIWSNDGLGIALASYVETTPSPVVDSVRVEDETASVFASIVGEPNQVYVFEFFSSASPDPSGFGEGERPLGTVETSTNQIGFASVSFGSTTALALPGSWITATATTEDLVGPSNIEVSETSPFSNAVQVLAPGGAVIAVEPRSLVFGQVALGDSVGLVFTVSNNGSVGFSGEIQPGATFTGNGFVLSEPAGSFTLDPGASKAFGVALRPGSLGTKASSIAILHNAPNESSPITVTLSGEGVTAVPVVEVKPELLGFGSIAVGSAKTLDAVIENSGTGMLTGTVEAGDGFVSNGFRFISGQGDYALSSGDSLVVSIRLKPGSVGAKVSTLLVTHNASNESSPIRVDLIGQGVAANALVDVSPLEIDFGEVVVGTTRIDTIAIRHAGGPDNLIGSVSDFGDLTDAGFYYASGGGLFDIAPGDSHLVRVAFSPDVAGTASAQLKVAHNGTNLPSSILIDLAGEGTVPQSKPLLTVSVDDSLEFGQVPVGSSASKSLVVGNNGAAPLAVSLSVIGAASGDFGFEGAVEAVSVDPGSSISIEVTFEPAATGEVVATLRIEHDAENVESPLDIILVGEGIGSGELGRPVLIEPANGSAAVLPPVRFRWNSVATATDYRLEVATASDFSALLLDQIVDSTTVPDIALEPGISHFWRVTARRDGAETTSDIWSFTTVRINRPPVAVDDSVTTLVGQDALIDALANDTDPDGDVLRIVGISESPLNGIAVFSTSIIQYFPNAGFVGNDRFRYRIRDIGGLEASALIYLTVSSGTDVESDEVPRTTELGQTYPNPLSLSGTLPFQLSEADHVRITLFDPLGHRIRTLVNGHVPAGRHEVTIDASSLSAGTYLFVMETRGKRFSRMIAVVR